MLTYILFTFLLSDFTQSVVKALPTWEADTLAQYEQPELAAVRQDLADGDEKQLLVDWDALEALDSMLHKRMVI